MKNKDRAYIATSGQHVGTLAKKFKISVKTVLKIQSNSNR